MSKTKTPIAKRTPPGEAVDFLPDADRIEQRRAPALARSVLYLIAVLIVALVTWASVSSIDSYVTARGKIITVGNHVVLQPLETSIVRELNVRKGQVVEKGEVLVAFDPTFSASDEMRLRAELSKLTAKLDRLGAESREEPFEPVRASEDALQEQDLNTRNRAERAARVAEMESRRWLLAASSQRLRRDAAQLQEQLNVMRELEGMKEKLTENGNTSRAAFLKQHLSTLTIERQLTATRQQLAEISAEIDGVERALESFAAQWKRKVLEDLIATRTRRDAVQEELRKATRRSATSTIEAPFQGFVLDVADRNTGSVVSAAEGVVTLVPTDQDLLAEIWIPARDIGKVSVGDHVRIKIESFPFQKHGLVEGRIESLSGDSFVGARDGNTAVAPGEVHYLARVSIPPIEKVLTNLPKGFRALPGMTLNAEVQVGQRQVISYFLYPVFRMLDESIRET
ncbi:HlyD family type I secretion periplasmic adaptor subunit [Roseovarius sp. 2305UL8-3]|uniref:HlyD family type I secretion periplasmic adaptor subunit n=1 Tax=Roseovarius conchicola TaxID=3121636 RepID=UPI0035299DD3